MVTRPKYFRFDNPDRFGGRSARWHGVPRIDCFAIQNHIKALDHSSERGEQIVQLREWLMRNDKL